MSQSQPRLKTSAMIASIADEGQATVSAPFGVALSKLAAQRPEIVGMTADLSKYTDLHIFAQAFPDRFFQMGMAEQLLMAAAGGMTGAAMALAVVLVFLRYRAVAQKQFGGISGDLAGWFLQKAELWMLAALAACSLLSGVTG